MKVSEKIKAEALKQGVKMRDVLGWMVITKTIPCEIEDNYNYLGYKRLRKLCSRHKMDCLACAAEYLNKEATCGHCSKNKI